MKKDNQLNYNNDKDKILLEPSSGKPLVLKKKRSLGITFIHYIALFLLVLLLLTYNIKLVTANTTTDDSTSSLASSEIVTDKPKNTSHFSLQINSLFTFKSDDFKTDEIRQLEKQYPVLVKSKNYYQIDQALLSHLSSNLKSPYFLFVLYQPDCPWSEHLLPILEQVSILFPNLTFFQVPNLKIQIGKIIYPKSTPFLAITDGKNIFRYSGKKSFIEIVEWIYEDINSKHGYKYNKSDFKDLNLLDNVFVGFNTGHIKVDNSENNNNNTTSENIPYTITEKNSYLLYFSISYVLFLIGLAIYRLFIQSIRRMKQD